MDDRENRSSVDNSAQKSVVDLIQSIYCPLVAVVCSETVNEICSKSNKLSFSDLLLPFHQLDTEGLFIFRVHFVAIFVIFFSVSLSR